MSGGNPSCAPFLVSRRRENRKITRPKMDKLQNITQQVKIAAMNAMSHSMTHLPKYSNQERTLLNFFSSPFFYALMFEALVVNRVTAIVAPRTPKPLPIWFRLMFRLPLVLAFAYFSSKFAHSIAAVHVYGEPPVNTSIHSDDEHNALGDNDPWKDTDKLFFRFFLSQCISYSVQILSCAFEMGPNGSLGNDNRPRQWQYDPSSPNLLEWAATFHFSASTKYLQSSPILCSLTLLHSTHLCILNIMAVFGLLNKYRLIPTTFFGSLHIAHFFYSIYSNNGKNYPILIYLARLPELCIICIVCLVAFLHLLTFAVTKGAVRTPSRILWRAPISLSEDFSLVLLKMGTTCMEATQAMGLTNEMDPVIVSRGSPLLQDLDDPKSLNASGFAHNDQTWFSQRGMLLDRIQSQNEENAPDQESTESSEMDSTTQLFTGRRKTGIFRQWSYLLALIRDFVYIGVRLMIPWRFIARYFYPLAECRQERAANTPQASEAHAEFNERLAAIQEPDSDDSDTEYVPSEQADSESDSIKDPEESNGIYEEIFYLNQDIAQQDLLENKESPLSTNYTMHLLTAQVPGRVTRRKYSNMVYRHQQHQSQSRIRSWLNSIWTTPPDETDQVQEPHLDESTPLRHLAASMRLRRSNLTPSLEETHRATSSDNQIHDKQSTQTIQNSEHNWRRTCVVCRSDDRQVVLRPCGCLCLCDGCREALASRRFTECPCCRRKVEGKVMRQDS